MVSVFDCSIAKNVTAGVNIVQMREHLHNHHINCKEHISSAIAVGTANLLGFLVPERSEWLYYELTSWLLLLSDTVVTF